MNNERRKRIEAIARDIENLKVAVENLKGSVEKTRSKEAAYFYKMSDSFKNSGKCKASEEAITWLDGCADVLDEAVSALSNSIE